MHAEYLEPDAAVRSSSAAGYTHTTVEVWFNGTSVSNLKPVGMTTDADDLDAEFMAQYTWIVEERLLAFESMQVSPADANAPDTNQRFVCTREFWPRNTGQEKLPRLLQDYGFHVIAALRRSRLLDLQFRSAVRYYLLLMLKPVLRLH
jgi:hypothetical protein